MSITNCSRTFLLLRSRQSGDLSVLLWVTQTCERDWKADVPVVLFIFCWLNATMSGRTLSWCRIALRIDISYLYLTIGHFHFIQQLTVVRSINCVPFMENMNERYTSAIPKTCCRFPSRKTGLGSLRCYFSRLSPLHVCLVRLRGCSDVLIADYHWIIIH